MTKRNRSKEPERHELPEYLKQWRLNKDVDLDFDDLRRQFEWLKFSVKAVVLPPVELMTALLAARSTNSKLKDEQGLWNYYDFPGNVNYELQIEEFNAHLKASGLPALVNGMPLDDSTWAAIIARGLERRRLSTAFLEAWAQLHVLAWRHAVIVAAQEDISMKFEKGRSDAAKQTTVAQHVWYARWVLKNTSDFDDDRPEADYRFVKMCTSIALGRRASPNDKHWPPEWFKKLLRKEHGPVGPNKHTLLERLSRLSENQLRKLAETKIPDHVLPPLTLK